MAAEPLDAWMARTVAAYYAARDPLGATGDFTTAPEVSQIFGEIIGLWAADAWLRAGAPAPFVLLECGPGRGTLMDDALRAAGAIPGFIDSVRIVFLESSPALRMKQRDLLKKYEPIWIENLDALPALPVFCIANEFLDALPIQQWRFTGAHWEQRYITTEDTEGTKNPTNSAPCVVQKWGWQKAPPPEGLPRTPVRMDIYEISPIRQAFTAHLSTHIARHGGAALFIDYGYKGPAPGDTIQAVKNHAYVDPLTPDADVTAHVDFAPLAAAARTAGLAVHGPITQRDFLLQLGAAQRAAQLGDIEGLHRLTAPDQMGTLFKVLTLFRPPGA